jgi:hypothetical protein
MQGLWKNKIAGWKKDSRRKKQKKYNFIKDKKSLFKRYCFSDLDNIPNEELNYETQKELFKTPNIWRRERKKNFFYNEIEHPRMANIVFGVQFSKKPYKKEVYRKSRSIDRIKLKKTFEEYKNSSCLIGLSLQGTYGLDPFFDISDKVLDLEFSYINKIDLAVN